MLFLQNVTDSSAAFYLNSCVYYEKNFIRIQN